MPINPTLTICVCACGRPEVVARCLESIAVGTVLPSAVLVSDDSPAPADREALQAIVGRYPFAEYLEGPRRGLCANRNRVIDAARTTHISLLDDDSVVGTEFVERALSVIDELPETVVSGDVLEDGVRRVQPSNQRFLGHFGDQPNEASPLQNINLNCNVLPLEAGRTASFDERIVYGYEDCDFCSQLAARGWRFSHRPDLVNSHLPPTRAVSSAQRHWQAERARFMTVTRRLVRWQPAALRMAKFAAVAPVHLALTAIRRGDLAHAWRGIPWLVADLVGSSRGPLSVRSKPQDGLSNNGGPA